MSQRNVGEIPVIDLTRSNFDFDRNWRVDPARDLFYRPSWPNNNLCRNPYPFTATSNPNINPLNRLNHIYSPNLYRNNFLLANNNSLGYNFGCNLGGNRFKEGEIVDLVNEDDEDKETKPSFDVNKPNFDVNKTNFDVNKPNFDVNKPNFDVSPTFDVNLPNFDVNKANFDVNKANFDVNNPNFDASKHNFVANKHNFDANKQNFEENQRNFEETKSLGFSCNSNQNSWQNGGYLSPFYPCYPQNYHDCTNYYPYRYYDNLYEVPENFTRPKIHQNCYGCKSCCRSVPGSFNFGANVPTVRNYSKEGQICRNRGGLHENWFGGPKDLADKSESAEGGPKLAPIEFISVNNFEKNTKSPKFGEKDSQNEDWRSAFEIITYTSDEEEENNRKIDDLAQTGKQRNCAEMRDAQNQGCQQSETNAFKCGICSDQFSQRSLLRKHELRHKRPNLCSCERLQQKRRRKSRKHIFTRTKSHTKPSSRLRNLAAKKRVETTPKVYHNKTLQSSLIPKITPQNRPKLILSRKPLLKRQAPFQNLRDIAPKLADTNQMFRKTLEVQIESSKEGQKYIFLNGKKYLIQQIVDTASGETFSAENFKENLENCRVENISLQTDQRASVFGQNPEYVELKTPNIEGKPANIEVTPNFEVKPNNFEVKPQNFEVIPQHSGRTPNFEVKPQNIQVRTQNIEMKTHNADKPQNIQVKPQNSEKPQNMNLANHLKPKNIHVNIPNLDVKPQNIDLKPPNSDLKQIMGLKQQTIALNKNVTKPSLDPLGKVVQIRLTNREILAIKQEPIKTTPKVVLKQEAFEKSPPKTIQTLQTPKPAHTFPCKSCKRSFTSLKYLARHVKSHNFQCAICQEKLNSKEMLQKHIQYHNSARLVCIFCNKDFSRKSALDSHAKTCFGQNVIQYKCDYCQEIFLSDIPLARHMKKHEAIDNSFRENQCFIVD